MYMYMYVYIYIYIYIIYTHKYIDTHLKKNVTVYLLRKCLGGPDMKQRSAGNPVKNFENNFVSYYVWNLVFHAFY